MERIQIPQVMLNSGHMMPLVALGTATYPLPPPEELTSIFLDAIATGYRHFDTAAFYKTEEPLGQAVAKALELGMIKNRDELFITSKLWCTDAHHDLVLPAIKETLRKLDLSYVDLYLIHWPVRVKTGEISLKFPLKFSKQDLLPFDIHSTWNAMEDCCKLGLAKSIGLSNFSCAKIHQLLSHATIPPSVNQVEMNIVWQQQKLMEFCKANSIQVSAWSPLGAVGVFWGSGRILKNQVLQNIAAQKKKTIAQTALRWIHEQGACIVVKSFNKERMKENIQLFDWDLSDEEKEQIQKIPQSRGITGDWFVHEDGPIKSVEELWDGEI